MKNVTDKQKLFLIIMLLRDRKKRAWHPSLQANPVPLYNPFLYITAKVTQINIILTRQQAAIIINPLKAPLFISCPANCDILCSAAERQ